MSQCKHINGFIDSFQIGMLSTVVFACTDCERIVDLGESAQIMEVEKVETD